MSSLTMNTSVINISISPEEYEKLWAGIKQSYEKYLKNHSIKLPGDKSIKSYQLVALFKHKGSLVSKNAITAYIQLLNTQVSGDQQVRHLKGDGYYLLIKGDIIPGTENRVPKGYYLLVTLDKPSPAWAPMKRKGNLDPKDWNDLKKKYVNCCATCGTEDGKPHRHFPTTIVALQQGHKNPNLPISINNIIPQCANCNNYYKDCSFDNFGRPKLIPNPIGKVA